MQVVIVGLLNDDFSDDSTIKVQRSKILERHAKEWEALIRTGTI